VNTGKALGGDDEKVRLFIAEKEITNIYQQYQITVSCFDQPAGFNLSLGDGATIADLRSRFKVGDPFELHIGDRKIVQGNIEYRGASGTPSVMQFRGRDGMAVLTGNTFLEDTTFQNETYVDLTRKVLELAGVVNPVVLTDNAEARKKFSGIQSTNTVEPDAAMKRATEISSVATALAVGAGASATPLGSQATLAAVSSFLDSLPTFRQVIRKVVTAKVGTKFLDFLNEQYVKAGLFLWATPDGEWVLSEPNATQSPSYRIVRQRGQSRNAGNVVTASLNEGGEDQHKSVTAYGRTGKGKSGRLKARGDFEDTTESATSHRFRMAFYDADLKSNEEAFFAARRRIAEERRKGRNVTYVVSGHKVLATSAVTRAIWTPDTVVDVEDHEYGIFEPLYLHTVTFERNPETTTALDLSWPEDVKYAHAEGE
jgi:prophage tail gpP-like protein